MKKRQLFVKNFIFGVEDSLVSTVGLLSGIASATVTKRYIIIAGLILILVEALSMGVGSLLSEDITTNNSNKNFDKKNIIAAIIMFSSYFIAGFIPLSPYLLLKVNSAFLISIILSLLSLFILGCCSLKHENRILSGMKMLILGGSVIFIASLLGIYIDNHLY